MSVVQRTEPSIAVGIISRNEAAGLEACLNTVPWATEIYVLDMQSSDNTREVAERFGATVLPVRDVPVAEQVRNTYLERFESDWLLQLDCDERVDPHFREQMLQVLAGETEGVAAYVLPFRLYACGVPLLHGMGHNGSVRFFRRGAVRYNDDQAAHRNPIMDGRLEDLSGRVPPIHHYAITSVDQYVSKSIRYAKTEALEITSADQLDPLITLRVFYQWFIAEEGWRDGFAGAMFTMIMAFSRGLPHAYAWEHLGCPRVPLRRKGKPVTAQNDIRRLTNDTFSDPLLAYGFADAVHGSFPTNAKRYSRAWRYRPSLISHPTTAKAIVKYSTQRIARRIRTTGSRS